MAVLRLHRRNLANPEITLACAELDWENALRLKGSGNNYFAIDEIHQQSLGQPWFGITMEVSCEMVDSEAQMRYQIFDPSQGADVADFLTKDNTDIVQVGNRLKVSLKDSEMTQVFPGYEGDINAPDAPVAMKVAYARLTALFNTVGDLQLYTIAALGNTGETYYAPVLYGQTLPSVNIPAYYQSAGSYSQRYVCDDGLYTVSFGCKNGYYYYDNYPLFVSGAATTGLSIYPSDNPYRLMVGDAYILSSFRYQQALTTSARLSYLDTDQPFPFGNCKLVHFVIPAGTYTYRNGVSFTLNEDKIMFGIAGYNLDANGKPYHVVLQAAESVVWKSAYHRVTDMGDDTVPGGGNGPFVPKTDNPLKDITRATKSGISTNPINQSGFFVYKFTDAQWSEFLGWLGSASNIGENENYIKFVYRSPLSFTTAPFTVNGIMMGSTEINKPGQGIFDTVPYTVNVVQSTIIEQSATGQNLWDAKSFLDLEPYAATSIQVPFCSRIDVPPSLIYGDEEKPTGVQVNVSYDILTRSAAAKVGIHKSGQGYTYYCSMGECACDCPTVIKRDIVGDVGKQLAPVVVSGAATLATGGTAAPMLIGTAAGAATGFSSAVQNLAKVNLPSGSSSGPYWDTVNAGQYTCSVLGVKSSRFTSGERVATERPKIIGYKSGYYVETLGEVGTGSYVEVDKMNINMSGGMSKGEADLIKALLREGVIL